MGFRMCGQRMSAKPDVCVVEGRNGAVPEECLLLVQEDKVRATYPDLHNIAF